MFSCWGNGDKYDNELIIEHDTKIESKVIADQILQNQELREFIVDLADIWDGPVSFYYGGTLYNKLKELGINDVPEFYKKENIDKIIKEMKKRRNE